MNFLFDAISNMISNVSQGASTFCVMVFFEPEVPKSLREE
ncbi:cyclic lactone autoinducer peptide [Romboutsia sedimentorum]|uniref:Cyclic lactone autoinducer peptide n=1 Tax=Romboutsia sedimentorum TaxID=1368474 RepID=A0ABT7E812_9FIRM|nr:cyclic lactone autoinducer peptide [Romboutsia sedimentorum]MDK2563072.1 cyclic lactone autoinducer peptide [Romboutsia sedimentorum]MDK2586207.1 cyclic lactone autoinducer peptide [Romboutsia sedimentorum]